MGGILYEGYYKNREKSNLNWLSKGKSYTL